MIRGLIEVDQGDWLVTEEHLAQRIGGSALTQGNGQAAQGLGDMKGFAAIAEPAAILHPADREPGRVVDERQRGGQRDRTGPITAGRSGQAESWGRIRL